MFQNVPILVLGFLVGEGETQFSANGSNEVKIGLLDVRT